jgi:GT2 family glycosyltransferase
MQNNPLVSIVVLNWNGKKFLYNCLHSLENQTYKNLEIILVDNNSTDNSVNFVRKNFPEAKIVQNKKNFGFAKGNNTGIKLAKGDYIFILNNDTKIDAKCVEYLVQTIEKNQKTGMMAPKIVSIENPKLIDSIGINIYPDGLARGRGRNEIDNGQYDNFKESLMPSACAALYRKKMLNEIGLFDEKFLAYCEDSDLGIRARLAGWKSAADPRAIVYHHYSGTFGKYSETKAFLTERNHFFVAIKNFPITLILFLPFYTLLRYLFIMYGLLKNKGPAAKFQSSKIKLFFILLKVYYSLVLSIPYLIKERRKIQKTKKISNRELLELFKKYKLKVSQVALLE